MYFFNKKVLDIETIYIHSEFILHKTRTFLTATRIMVNKNIKQLGITLHFKPNDDSLKVNLAFEIL